jgi:FkbH-like protein
MRKNPNFSDVSDYVDKHDADGLPQINITILRNVMLESIENYLKYFALKDGLSASISFGNYDNIIQDAISVNGILDVNTDYVFIFAKLEHLSPKLAYGFVQQTPEEIEFEKHKIFTFIETTLGSIRKRSNAMITWHSFELPLYPAFGTIDASGNAMQTAVINELNDYLRSRLSGEKSAYLIDMNLCIARIGGANFYDQRYWHIGKAPYSLVALEQIAGENHKLIRAQRGKNKKCIVLDCDNTLWGGVIGEDGLNGINLGSEFPGSAFKELQHEILNLYHRGIILALCSKNNEADVWEVFDKHLGMVLKKEHISAFRINWHDKAQNLKSIAHELNIGLDSLVFVDDSDFETNLVKQILPEVEVIHLPPKQVVSYREIIASCGLFDSLNLTEEDRKRGQMYKAESERLRLKEDSQQNIDEFLRSLEMKVKIRIANHDSVPRVSQLTQKTNQFNLTTKRYSEAEIMTYIESTDTSVLYISLSDRFGDMGVIGVAILKFAEHHCEVDTFLLSCRALGRGIESIFLNACIALTKSKGRETLIGQYFKTIKNEQVSDFYLKEGFDCVSQDEFARKFLFSVSEVERKLPEHFNEVIITI